MAKKARSDAAPVKTAGSTPAPIRVAIAGQGRSGFAIHARWLREDGQRYHIVAVADQLPERRRQATDEFGCRAYKTWEQMLKAGQFDLFVNALPSNLHPKATIAALKAGFNVICEKPAAVKLADFDKMVAAARQSRRMLAFFQNSRFYPFFEKVQEVLESGVLGRIVHITMNWSGFARRWDWQTRQELWGGNINNTGPHPMDHAVVLFGEKMPSVFARLESGPNTLGDADDFAMVVLHGKASPTVEVLVSSYQSFPRGEHINISGTKGGLTGGPKGLKWKWLDAKKSPRIKLLKGWSEDRKYCGEQLAWNEATWDAKPDADDFQGNSRAFYSNVFDVLAGNGKLRITHEQVRRQVAVLEECHRQNKLPPLGRKKFV